MILAATGHRPQKLGGYSEAVYQRLVDLATMVLTKHQPIQVISGMALGWDQAWCEAAIRLNIPVVAAVPFAGQESKWPAASQTRYHHLISQCAEVVVVCEGGYSPAAMQKRNLWMVDRCDKVIALWDGTTGGTHNCVMYARKVEREILNYWSSWVKYSGT